MTPEAKRWQANLQAIRLRRAGLPYTSISIVMRMYHGVDLAPEVWRGMCRKAGVPGRPQGRRPEGYPQWRREWAA